MTLPRYAVENRYQDEGWTITSYWASEQEACEVADKASYDSISYGMVRVVDTKAGAILREYGAGSNGKYTVPTTVSPAKPRVLMDTTFYVVFCDRHLPDAVMQNTYTDERYARRQAEIMVSKYPDDTFYIMRVVGKVEAQKVVYTEYPKEGSTYRHEKSVGWLPTGVGVRTETLKDGELLPITSSPTPWRD